MHEVVPLVIVGCGPAGLAAASVLSERAPQANWLAIEAGAALNQRDRDDPHDVIAGIGGAGLYSDGKFSFYPAATALWRLENGPRLLRAYHWVLSLLSEWGVLAPHFLVPPPDHSPGLWKPYPSVYLDLETRRRLIERLYEPLTERIWLGTKLLDLDRLPDGSLRLSLERSGKRLSLHTKALLCAGGRFFPLRFARCAGGDLPMRFRRWEIGLRIEGPTAHPFFVEVQSAGRSRDPKLILRDEGRSLEWRTFCCCIDGEVIETRFDDFLTLSGRADGAPTGRSNIGFNVRFLDGSETIDLNRLRGQKPFRVPFRAAIEKGEILDGIYGSRAGEALREGLERLCSVFSSLRENSPQLTAAGPTLEGVGYYPATTGNLALEGWPIYFAGDACGRFRGLVAALVSGAYTGEAIARDLGEEMIPPGSANIEQNAAGARAWIEAPVSV